MPKLIESDLGGLLAHIDVLEESTVSVVRLLLNGGTELEQLIRDRLAGSLEDVDQTAYG